MNQFCVSEIVQVSEALTTTTQGLWLEDIDYLPDVPWWLFGGCLRLLLESEALDKRWQVAGICATKGITSRTGNLPLPYAPATVASRLDSFPIFHASVQVTGNVFDSEISAQRNCLKKLSFKDWCELRQRCLTSDVAVQVAELVITHDVSMTYLDADNCP